MLSTAADVICQVAWYVPNVSGCNIAATRKCNKCSIAEMCCANTCATLKWPCELCSRYVATAHSTNTAALRCHITVTSIRDVAAVFHFNCDFTIFLSINFFFGHRVRYLIFDYNCANKPSTPDMFRKPLR